MARSLATAAANVARDSHYVKNPVSGLYERALLIEGAGTNLVTQSENFGAWSLGGTPVRTPGQADPAGGTAAYLLQDDDATAAEQVYLATTFAGDGTKAVALFLKAGTAARTEFGIFDLTANTVRVRVRATWTAGVPTLTIAGGAGTLYPVEDWGNGWYRLAASATGVVAANTNWVQISPASAASVTDVGTVYAFGVQAENATFASSYIKTTGATATRQADNLSRSMPLAPQTLTAYARIVERGTVLSSPARVFQVGKSDNTSPRLILSNQGTYQWLHGTSAGVVSINAAATPSVGDLVEFRCLLFADGSVQMGQTINGGTEAMTARSAALPLASAWSDAKLWVGGLSTQWFGFAGFLALKILPGEWSLADCRAAA